MKAKRTTIYALLLLLLASTLAWASKFNRHVEGIWKVLTEQVDIYEPDGNHKISLKTGPIEQDGEILLASMAVPPSTASANTAYFGPTSGLPAAPGFRAMVTGDVPATLESKTLQGPTLTGTVTRNAQDYWLPWGFPFTSAGWTTPSVSSRLTYHLDAEKTDKVLLWPIPPHAGDFIDGIKIIGAVASSGGTVTLVYGVAAVSVDTGGIVSEFNPACSSTTNLTATDDFTLTYDVSSAGCLGDGSDGQGTAIENRGMMFAYLKGTTAASTSIDVIGATALLNQR